MNILDIARKAELVIHSGPPKQFMKALNRFATLLKAAHLEELCQGVEMPEPDLWFDEDTLQTSRTKPSRPTFVPYYTAEQLASAVARERQQNALQGISDFGQWEELLAKKDENIRMLEIVEKEMAKDIDALTAEVERLTTLQELTDANFRDVKTKRDALTAELAKKDAEIKRAAQNMKIYSATIDTLTAERDRLKAALEVALAHGSFEQGSGVIHDIRAAMEGKSKTTTHFYREAMNADLGLDFKSPGNAR